MIQLPDVDTSAGFDTKMDLRNFIHQTICPTSQNINTIKDNFQFTYLVFFKLFQSAHIRYFCENSVIAHAALVLKDTSHHDLQANNQFWTLRIFGKLLGNFG